MNKNNSKQTAQIAVLAALVIVVIIVAVMQVKAMSPKPAPGAPASSTAQAQPPAAAAAPSAPKVAETGEVEWVNEERLPALVAQVKARRSPFKNVFPDGRQIAAVPQPRPMPSPVNTRLDGYPNPFPTFSPGPGSVVEPLVVPQEEEVALEWTSPDSLGKDLSARGFAVTVKPGAQPDRAVIAGAKDDVSKAVTWAKRLDLPRAGQDVTVSGVVITPSQRFATLALEGRYYTLVEDDTLPRHQQWIVSRISTAGVTLSKGQQSVQLRLSGGSQQ